MKNAGCCEIDLVEEVKKEKGFPEDVVAKLRCKGWRGDLVCRVLSNLHPEQTQESLENVKQNIAQSDLYLHEIVDRSLC